MNALEFYQAKLAFQTDAFDVKEQLDNKAKIIVVDTRHPDKFKQEHIPGAINMPHTNMSKESTKNWSKEVLYITYCDGIGCNGSTKGARNLAKLQFNVKELLGGIVWWKQDGYATKGTKAQQASEISCGC